MRLNAALRGAGVTATVHDNRLWALFSGDPDTSLNAASVDLLERAASELGLPWPDPETHTTLAVYNPRFGQFVELPETAPCVPAAACSNHAWAIEAPGNVDEIALPLSAFPIGASVYVSDPTGWWWQGVVYRNRPAPQEIPHTMKHPPSANVSASHIGKVLGAAHARADISSPRGFGVIRETVLREGFQVFSVGSAVFVAHRVEGDGRTDPSSDPRVIEAKMQLGLDSYAPTLRAAGYRPIRETMEGTGYPVLIVHERETPKAEPPAVPGDPASAPSS